MALQNYVLSKYMSSISSDDIELDVNQLMENGSYSILRPKNLIAHEIFNILSVFLDAKYTERMIRVLLDLPDGKYRLASQNFGTTLSMNCIVLSVNAVQHTYSYDMSGSFLCHQSYIIQQIDTSNVGYLVTEHIIDPEKGCDLIERCYEPYFDNLFMAKQYQSACMRNYKVSKGTPNSGYRISVIDVNIISKSEWYLLNIQAANDIIKYQLDSEDYRYMKNIDLVKGAILADAYDDLDDSEKIKVNNDIFEKMKPFISEDYLSFLEDDITESNDINLIEDTADSSIVLAFIGADTEKTFQKIHEILGPTDYRVGALTDDIYNTHPDDGYIVVSKDGDIGWYASCYAINEWEGSISSEFHGKFQPNENDVLLCFREFHPELISERLPSKSDIQDYDDLYQQSKANERSAHVEMDFDCNDDGDEVVFGTWYYEGLLSDNFTEDTCFFRKYGSHLFTEDECRRLLSGEELIIEHFITKMEFEVTIKGKLIDCATMFDDMPQVSFVRTDIDTNNRKSINSGLGITEPGLPPIVDSDE